VFWCSSVQTLKTCSYAWVEGVADSKQCSAEEGQLLIDGFCDYTLFIFDLSSKLMRQY